MANPPPLYPYYNDSQTVLLRKILTNLALIAETGGGGGGSTTLQKGSVDLVAGQQSYAVVFTTPFASAPTTLPQPVVMMPDDSGEVLSVSYDLSTLTTNGVIAWLSAVPTAASTGGKLIWTAGA